jgi:hypothetical protein
MRRHQRLDKLVLWLSSFGSPASSLENRARMLTRLATKLKRAESSRATNKPSRMSYRTTSISSSPRRDAPPSERRAGAWDGSTSCVCATKGRWCRRPGNKAIVVWDYLWQMGPARWRHRGHGSRARTVRLSNWDLSWVFFSFFQKSFFFFFFLFFLYLDECVCVFSFLFFFNFLSLFSIGIIKILLYIF